MDLPKGYFPLWALVSLVQLFGWRIHGSLDSPDCFYSRVAGLFHSWATQLLLSFTETNPRRGFPYFKCQKGRSALFWLPLSRNPVMSEGEEPRSFPNARPPKTVDTNPLATGGFRGAQGKQRDGCVLPSHQTFSKEAWNKPTFHKYWNMSSPYKSDRSHQIQMRGYHQAF